MPHFPITHITVHCSATKAKMNIGAKEIDRMHKERSFSGIGYHYVIRRDGTVEKGRPDNQVGAHVGGHNTANLGVCLVGGIAENMAPENNFTDAQFTALRKLLGELKTRHPNAKILGHRDWPGVAKACPCFDVRSWLAKG